jgi:hydrogenase maturation protease
VDLLLIGFGNPGRLDDGLGPALAEAVGRRKLPGVTVDADYQLTVEDAAEVARHEVVLFADADAVGPEPFSCRRLRAGNGRPGFSSHSVEPETVVTLARELFAGEPEAFLLGIRGYEFDAFGERLSERAEANLADAVKYVVKAARDGAFEEVRAELGDRAASPLT